LARLRVDQRVASFGAVSTVATSTNSTCLVAERAARAGVRLISQALQPASDKP
jgi:hypothetical protein